MSIPLYPTETVWTILCLVLAPEIVCVTKVTGWVCHIVPRRDRGQRERMTALAQRERRTLHSALGRRRRATPLHRTSLSNRWRGSERKARCKNRVSGRPRVLQQSQTPPSARYFVLGFLRSSGRCALLGAGAPRPIVGQRQVQLDASLPDSHVLQDTILTETRLLLGKVGILLPPRLLPVSLFPSSLQVQIWEYLYIW